MELTGDGTRRESQHATIGSREGFSAEVRGASAFSRVHLHTVAENTHFGRERGSFWVHRPSSGQTLKITRDLIRRLRFFDDLLGGALSPARHTRDAPTHREPGPLDRDFDRSSISTLCAALLRRRREAPWRMRISPPATATCACRAGEHGRLLQHMELMSEDGTCDAAVLSPRDRAHRARPRLSRRDAPPPNERANDRNPETLETGRSTPIALIRLTPRPSDPRLETKPTVVRKNVWLYRDRTGLPRVRAR